MRALLAPAYLTLHRLTGACAHATWIALAAAVAARAGAQQLPAHAAGELTDAAQLMTVTCLLAAPAAIVCLLVSVALLRVIDTRGQR